MRIQCNMHWLAQPCFRGLNIEIAANAVELYHCSLYSVQPVSIKGKVVDYYWGIIQACHVLPDQWIEVTHSLGKYIFHSPAICSATLYFLPSGNTSCLLPSTLEPTCCSTKVYLFYLCYLWYGNHNDGRYHPDFASSQCSSMIIT